MDVRPAEASKIDALASRNMINVLDTPAGTFSLEVWRYEKSLRPGAGIPRC